MEATKLSNHYGQPLYPVENGFYHLVNSGKEKTVNYLRITETELRTGIILVNLLKNGKTRKNVKKRKIES